MQRIFIQFSRFFVGILFIISGAIKLNDPIGTAIKLEEYFEVFANDFHPLFMTLIPYALAFSIFLNVLEIVLGVAVLIQYKMKTVSWILLLLIVFFSFLTFYSAYFNKVTDCGCFGDAIKLKPWESFTKDMVLLVFVGVLFYYKNGLNSTFSKLSGHFIIGGMTVFCCFIGWRKHSCADENQCAHPLCVQHAKRRQNRPIGAVPDRYHIQIYLDGRFEPARPSQNH